MKTSLIALSSLALLGTAFAQEGGDNSQNSRPVFQGINRNPAESTTDAVPANQGFNRQPAESSAPDSTFQRNNGAPAKSDPVPSPVVNEIPRFESSPVNNTPRFEQTIQPAPTPSPSVIPAPRGVPANVTASTESAKSTFVPVPEMAPITPLAPVTPLPPIADEAPIAALAPIADQTKVADQAPVAATAPVLDSTCSTQLGAPHCGTQVQAHCGSQFQAHCNQAPAYFSEQTPHCQTYVGNAPSHVVSVCVIHSTQECRVGYDHCGRPFQYNVTLVTFQETLSDGTTRTYTREA